MKAFRLFLIFSFLAFGLVSTQAVAATPESARIWVVAGSTAGDEIGDRDADRFDTNRNLSDSDTDRGFGSGPNISSEITPYDRAIDMED